MLQREEHEGWLDAPNMIGDKHVGDQSTWSGRLSALWQATDRLSIDLWAEYYRNNANGLAVRNLFDPEPDPRTTSNDFPTPQRIRSKIAAATIGYNLDFATLKSITSYQDAVYNTSDPATC